MMNIINVGFNFKKQNEKSKNKLCDENINEDYKSNNPSKPEDDNNFREKYEKIKIYYITLVNAFNKLKEEIIVIKKNYNKLIDDFNQVSIEKYKSDYYNKLFNEENNKLKIENEDLRNRLGDKNKNTYNNIDSLKENINEKKDSDEYIRLNEHYNNLKNDYLKLVDENNKFIEENENLKKKLENNNKNKDINNNNYEEQQNNNYENKDL